MAENTPLDLDALNNSGFTPRPWTSDGSYVAREPHRGLLVYASDSYTSRLANYTLMLVAPDLLALAISYRDRIKELELEQAKVAELQRQLKESRSQLASLSPLLTNAIAGEGGNRGVR